METGEKLVNPFKKGSEIMRATSPEYEGPPLYDEGTRLGFKGYMGQWWCGESRQRDRTLVILMLSCSKGRGKRRGTGIPRQTKKSKLFWALKRVLSFLGNNIWVIVQTKQEPIVLEIFARLNLDPGRQRWLMWGMFICKRPAPLDDYLQKVGPSG